MTVLLELALAMELIVTSYFWAVLWHEVSGAAKFQHNPLRKAGLAMDHSVPIFLLLIEYIFMDAAPVTLRHLWVFMLVSLAYLITNLTVTLTSQPVYPDVTWKGAKGKGCHLASWWLRSWRTCFSTRSPRPSSGASAMARSIRE